MKERNGKRRKVLSFIVIVGILTLFLASIQTVLADDQVDLSFMFCKPNQPPVIIKEYPTNDSITVGLQVICQLQISDPDNDIMNISWYENSTGSWHYIITTALVHSGTYPWPYLLATGYSTTYYWRVIVNDGNCPSITATYHFTTAPKPSAPPSPPIPPEEQNQPPIAKITGPNNAYENETMVFYATDSYDPDGNITGYQWDFENDGLFETGWMEEALITHSYSHPGNYTILLQVKDNDGTIATASHTITIIQLVFPLKLPIPQINSSYYYGVINKNITLPGFNGPYYGYTNENITFNSTGTYDPDGTIINYTWYFGDGNISHLQNPVYAYAKPGNYTVILKVTDNDNLSNLTTTKAIICDRAPKTPEERELPLTFPLILIIAIIIAIVIALLFLPKGYQITVLIEKDDSNKDEGDNIESKVDEILSESDENKGTT